MVGFPPLISAWARTFTASMAGDLGAAAAQSTGESLLKMPTSGCSKAFDSKNLQRLVVLAHWGHNFDDLVEVDAQFKG